MRAYYFAPDDGKLAYGDGRLVEVGATHTVDCTPKVCKQGLHASIRPIDALGYAPGSQLYIVDVGCCVEEGTDKICGTSRTYLHKIPNSEQLLRKFARAVALDSVLKYYPDIDNVVIEYLETGREDIRDAACDAAWDAACDAAWDAACDAAWDAACDAAWDAACDAAWAAASGTAWDAARGAARDAARGAARDAAWDRQNDLLTMMIGSALSVGAVHPMIDRGDLKCLQ